MNDQHDLEQFAANLQQEVISRASLEDQEEFLGDAFTRIMIDYLADAGELDDGEVCFHKTRGIEVSGYHLSDDEDVLDLFVSIFNQTAPPVSVTRTDFETYLKRLTSFFKHALDGYHSQLEEASPVCDMAARIHEARTKLDKIRFFVFTDGVTKAEVKPPSDLHGLRPSVHIWDIERLFRCISSGRRRETIEIDFVSEFGEAIPCLEVPSDGTDYHAYLAIIPGSILFKLYDQYGPRLLELNVRSFLQARGKVNKGIRDTIIKEPDRFLAYNNGITVTASEVKIQTLDDGGKGIAWVRDFQVVNGGQTTASIYHTARKDNADPGAVHVQAKLSVIAPERIDEIVPLISRYANSQNKVNDADFSANDPFHVQLEELSRTVWAPAADGTQRQTRWFYERARGQYLDAKGRAQTPARKREFTAVHPNSQKFTKTDLAKFENTWDQLPHKVSYGAQKNFREFTIRLSQRRNLHVDQQYFERLVAKAILFRRAEKIVSAQEFGGYRANIVTYTLAYLSHRTGQRIDLEQIWRKQDITPALDTAITQVCRKVHKTITNPPGGRNVTEWCKRDQCWEKVRSLEVRFPDELKSVLVSTTRTTRKKAILKDELTKEDIRNIKMVTEVPADVWFELSRWAKQTDNLEPHQRGIAYTLGRVVGQGKEPSRKQAWSGVRILEEAKRLGFQPTAEGQTS
ncbi:MAG TPA: AIPR family protein [Thermoguttaceae bacterium]|nr:AIPR family protein [Thermoguttaceae bacterium]